MCRRSEAKRSLVDLVIILLTAGLFFGSISVDASFQFNPSCQQAMQEILDLRLADARARLESEKRRNPENGYIPYLEHYADAMELLITEDSGLYNHLADRFDGRLDEIERVDDGTPYAGWLEAEMLFQMGLAQIKFGTRISGVTKLMSAYRKIHDHRDQYPDFWQSQKLIGMYNILLDNVPSYMRWAADLFGFSGNSELGLYQLEQYYEQASDIPGLSEEAALVMNLGLKLAHRDEDAFLFLQGLDEDMKARTLVRYLLATAATFTYRNGLALEVLSGIDPEALQVRFFSLDYIIGRSKLNHLEEDANICLERYLKDYPGLDFKKDVCNRLSYYYFIQGDHRKYQEYKDTVAVVGQDFRERDQEASLESRTSFPPQLELLKARLLCDGGYFEEALSIMQSIHPGELAEKSYQLEYHYRLGRIYQLNGNVESAIPELTMSYEQGRQEPFTFATRAAYFLGRVFETRKDYAAASLWYKRCLEAFSSSHTTEGVRDDAEKGMKRLKGKF